MGGNWGSWTLCSITSGTKSRQRPCNNPAPENGGRSCGGSSSETVKCAVNGNWGSWGSWSICDNGGTKTRRRTCNNPAPLSGGRSCSGSSIERASCTCDGGWRCCSSSNKCDVGQGD